MIEKNPKLILLTDVIEQKLRKEQELEFYLKELAELQSKIRGLQNEVNLTNTIIDMIQSDTVVDFKEEFLEKNSDKMLENKHKDHE